MRASAHRRCGELSLARPSKPLLDTVLGYLTDPQTTTVSQPLGYSTGYEALIRHKSSEE